MNDVDEGEAHAFVLTSAFGQKRTSFSQLSESSGLVVPPAATLSTCV